MSSEVEVGYIEVRHNLAFALALAAALIAAFVILLGMWMLKRP